MTTEKLPELPMGMQQILKILPHRYPFLLVDKIMEMNLEDGVVVGKKNVTMNESFFQGHFPDAPIMPGVLILEALAQTAGVMVHLKDQHNRIGVLLNVSKAKFRRPVHPGDTLMMSSQLLHFGSKGVRVKAQAFVEEKSAVEAELALALVERSQL